MSPRKALGLVLAIGTVGLFGLGLWFRVTSLGTAPVPHGDEAYYGYQAGRLLRGERPAGMTASDGLIDPVWFATQVPVMLLTPPSYAAARVPAVVSGVLAVLLTYVLFRRAIGPAAAGLAAGLLASLPIAIIYSRIAWEPSLIPLWGVLTIGLAMQGRPLRMLVPFFFGLATMPTSVLLAPVLLALLAERRIRVGPAEAGERRRLEAAMLTVVATAVVLYLVKRNDRRVEFMRTFLNFRPHNWGLYLAQYQKTLLGYCHALVETGPAVDAAFWSVVGVTLALGAWRLVALRRWDRLALVAGWLVSAAGFHVAIGPDGFHPAVPRYGLYLAVPTVLSLACLAESLLVAPTGPRRAVIRQLGLAGMLLIGFSLLWCYRAQWLTRFEAASEGRESPWTLRTELREALQGVHRVIDADMRRAPRTGPVAADARGEARGTVIADDWWIYYPLKFFFVRSPGVQLGNMERVGPSGREALLRERLGAGAYAVSRPGSEFEKTLLAAVPRGRLRLWFVHQSPGSTYVVYRQLREGEIEVGVNRRGSVIR